MNSQMSTLLSGLEFRHHLGQSIAWNIYLLDLASRSGFHGDLTHVEHFLSSLHDTMILLFLSFS